MTDPQPSCSEIVDALLDPIPSTHHPIFTLKSGGEYYCMDKDNLKKIFTEALQAKQKTIEELQHKYDLAIEEVDKLARQLDFSETTLRAYESYRIFKQDSFREVDGGAPVKEIDPVKAFEVIEDLKAEVERQKELNRALGHVHLRNLEYSKEVSRLREALEKIVRNWPCDNNECGRIAKQALSKTWEEGE